MEKAVAVTGQSALNKIMARGGYEFNICER
jgi:hypothetical protein